MDDMKNLVIQTLETKGLLGQIRAKLRSAVFKVVDEQDSRINSLPSGCGLNWENPNLYKIKETSIGGLTAEMIREYMEYFRMDYSLSVFIPECSISPERLKKDDIHARLGLNITGFNTEIPFIYYIIYYFMESAHNNPQKVFEFMNRIGNNIEKISDEMILKNYYYKYQANLNNEEDIQVNQTGENNVNNMQNDKNMNEVLENNSLNESNRNQNKNNFTSNNDIGNADCSNNIPNKNNETNKANTKGNKPDYEFQKLNIEDFGNAKKYYDLDDIKISNRANKFDKFENNLNKVEKKVEPTINVKENPISEKVKVDKVNQIHHEDSIHSEIYEEIYDVEDSFQKSAEKKMQSWSNPYNISHSGGYDGTVDSNALEKYNYIEPVEK